MTADTNQPGEVTQLLRLARQGDAGALDQLVPLVYEPLRQQAARYLQDERHRLTLQPTALVHEVYLQLAANRRIQWHDREHFLAVSAQLMRRVLVDHARARLAQKRGGGATHVTLGHASEADSGESSLVDVLMLDQTLLKLAALDARQARIVELRVFAGLTVEETAAALEVSPRTVKSDWQMARAWLTRELSVT